jgi:metallo-beta-lactamase class B
MGQTIGRAVLAAGLLLVGQIALRSQQAVPFDPDWVKPFPAFRLIGNIHWVGSWDLGSYLITTPQGHLLINSGMKQAAPEIVAGIEALGFRPTDVKLLLATHAHFDHVAGLAELQRITHATIAMSQADAELFESGGTSDFLFGGSSAAHYETAKVGRILADGEKVSLGGTELTVHLHPGHTKGATSFTMRLTEDGRSYSVGIMNLGSINDGVDVSGMPAFPDIGAAYRKTFQAQKVLRLDVWFASHAGQFGLHRKYQPGDVYDPTRWVDPEGYQAAVARMEAAFNTALQQKSRAK